ncbi:helix-turn-helix domain-containing protein [Albidovulum inexpectatum]|uniref:helix-turn-helix domain-containing protein n=1 Tax=Albidovulum inexpectatum TaxID=196587 RepID=UPI0014727EFB|nr:helix-turn-helix domain-containing protein [Albidovulum inexpectatum]
MSIDLIRAIWDRGPESPNERFVLVALADYANEHGECWPSIDGLCRKTRLSERGVQSILRRLEKAGWVRVVAGGGRSNTNRYTIVLPVDLKQNPAPDAPFTGENPALRAGIKDETPQEKHRFSAQNPAAAAPFKEETPQLSAENPAAAAPEPPLTTNGMVVVGDARARDQLPVDRSNVVPHPAAATASADELYDRVLAAAGLTSGRLPTWWLPPAATLHVAKWRQLDLTDDEIVEVVRQTQARFDDRPTSPKAFDFAMRRYAAEKNHQIETPQPAAQQETRTGGKSQKDYFDGYLERLKKRLGVDDEEFEKYLRLQ